MEDRVDGPNARQRTNSDTPEKPLELGTNAEKGTETLKKVNKRKPSKFKSIFTKSQPRRSLSEENGGGVGSGGMESNGKGDTKGVQVATTSGGDDEKGDTCGSGGNNHSQITSERRKEVRISGIVEAHIPKEDKRMQQLTRRSTSRTSGHVKNHQNHHRDPRSLKRSSVQSVQMKQKNRELLLLVEELTNNCEYYRNALKQKEHRQEKDMYEIMKENESLNLEICKLSQEVDAWQAKCQKMENKSMALTKAKTLTKENKNLVDDIEVLKSVICRLNKELAYYQDKLRIKYHNAPENIPTYSTSSGTDGDEEHRRGESSPRDLSGDWLQFPRRSLLPLLVAYDEVIAEKEEIIREHEMTIDRFKARCMEIIRENEDLHKLISESKDKGSISIEEWEFLRSNAVLVLEENDLLHEQLETLKKKEEVLFQSFQDKAAKFKNTIRQSEGEIAQLKGTIAELEGKCKQATEEKLSISASMQSRIPREKHDAMVHEFKLTFEELKSTYQSDRRSLCDKIESFEKERDRLAKEISELESENSRLRGDLRECESSLAANAASLQHMKTAVVEVTSARDATSGVMEDFMKHVQQLVADKNKLVEELSEQKGLNEQIMALRSREKELVAELHDKIEAMEHLHNEEVKTLQIKVKELQDALKSLKDRHRQDTSQLHELLSEKERRIQTIETEKKQLEVDLETVWRTTTTTMQSTIKSRHH